MTDSSFDHRNSNWPKITCVTLAFHVKMRIFLSFMANCWSIIWHQTRVVVIAIVANLRCKAYSNFFGTNTNPFLIDRSCLSFLGLDGESASANTWEKVVVFCISSLVRQRHNGLPTWWPSRRCAIICNGYSKVSSLAREDPSHLAHSTNPWLRKDTHSVSDKPPDLLHLYS